MGWLVDRKKTHTRTIKDPETGETAQVEIRKLAEGDYQQREGLSITLKVDQQRRRRKGRKARRNNDTDLDFTPGRMRMFEIERGLVSWTLPFECDAVHIRQLDPAIAKQIHEHIQDINPFFFDTDDDEEEDEDELEEGSEVTDNVVALPDNGEPAEQEFGHDNGPKEQGEQS